MFSSRRLFFLLAFVSLSSAAIAQEETPRDPASRASSKAPPSKAGPHRDTAYGTTKPVVYEVTMGVRMKSNSNDKKGVQAGTVTVADWPEQTVELIEKKDIQCRSSVRQIKDGGAMIVVQTNPLRQGMEASAIYKYRVTVRPIMTRLTKADFPATQKKPGKEFGLFLKSSPGIEANNPEIKKLEEKLSRNAESDWDKLMAYFEFVHKEIEYREQAFTSAKEAVEKRIGDCEEKSAVFIALARAAGIPSRLVWTPGHVWAEFHLVDKEGEGHWIPAHTSGAAWFGFLPAANVILQKGDAFSNVRSKSKGKQRLLNSWYRASDPMPAVEFIQDVRRLDANESAVPAEAATGRESTKEEKATKSGERRVVRTSKGRE